MISDSVPATCALEHLKSEGVHIPPKSSVQVRKPEPTDAADPWGDRRWRADDYDSLEPWQQSYVREAEGEAD